MTREHEGSKQSRGGAVVTVGTYDGVHLGHQRLLAEVGKQARAMECEVVVVTFDRNPLEIVRPERAPRQLTDLAFKLELLNSRGPGRVVVLTFDQARAAEEPDEFVRSVLVDELDARAVLVGSTFRFGHRQVGDVKLLEELGHRYGFLARGIELVTDDATHGVVSSTRVRALVAEGSLDAAARLLGRPHEVRGRPVGDGHLAAVVVPGSIALPKAGSYDALVGELGARGHLASVVVPESAGDPTSPVVLEVLAQGTPIEAHEDAFFVQFIATMGAS